MARIQILELPAIYRENGDDETPFAVVIDQVQNLGALVDLKDGAAKLGARAVLVFEETVDIPANQVTLEDGQTMQLKIQLDTTELDGKVRAMADEFGQRLSQSIRTARRYAEGGILQPGLTTARNDTDGPEHVDPAP